MTDGVACVTVGDRRRLTLPHGGYYSFKNSWPDWGLILIVTWGTCWKWKLGSWGSALLGQDSQKLPVYEVAGPTSYTGRTLSILLGVSGSKPSKFSFPKNEYHWGV